MFEETEGFDVERAAAWAVAQDGPVFQLTCQEAIELLADCLEGSTFFEAEKDNVSASTIRSYKQAATAAAARIEILRGAPVIPCFD